MSKSKSGGERTDETDKGLEGNQRKNNITLHDTEIIKKLKRHKFCEQLTDLLAR